MYSALLRREMLRPYLGYTRRSKRILSLFSTLVWGLIFTALELVIYVALYKKLDSFSGFNYAFIVLVDEVMVGLVCLALTPGADTAMFRSQQDRLILGPRPVKRFDILFSKLTYVYFRALVYTGATFLALSVAYGVLSGQPTGYYPLIVVGWLFLSLAVTLIVMLLTIPYSLLKNIVQGKAIAVFIITICLAFLLAYVYSLLLQLFISLIRGSGLNQLFTTERVNRIIDVSEHFYPVSCLVDVARLVQPGRNIGVFVGVLLGLALVSFPCFTAFFFHHLTHPRPSISKGHAHRWGVTNTPTGALIKKELVLSLGKGDGVCSYVTLVAVQPFLVYLVLSSVNTIFTTGDFNYIFTLYPQIIAAVDALLFLMFISVINTASSASLNTERNTLRLMKTFPVTPRRQMAIKILVPYVLAAISMLATSLVLWGLGVFTGFQTPIVLIAGLLAVLALNLVNAYSDLKRRSPNGAFNALIGFLAPVIITVASAVLTQLVKGHMEIGFDGTNALLFLFVAGLELLVCIIVGTVFFFGVNREFLKFQGGDKQ